MDNFRSETRILSSPISRSGSYSTLVARETLFSGGGKLVKQRGGSFDRYGCVGRGRGVSYFKDKATSEERERKVQIGCGSARGESRSYSKKVQDGDTEKGALSASGEVLGSYNRPQGGLLSHSHRRELSEVSRNIPSGKDSSLQDIKFWSFASTLDLHKGDPASFDHAKGKRNYLFSLSRRFHHPWSFFRRGVQHSSTCRASSVRQARFMHKRGERSANSSSNSGVFGHEAGSSEGNNLHSREEEGNCESRSEKDYRYILKGKEGNSDEKACKHPRSGGSIRSSLDPSKSVLSFAGRRNSLWKRRWSKLGRYSLTKSRVSRGSGRDKESRFGKHGKNLQNIREGVDSLHRRKLHGLGSIPSRLWLCKRKVVRTPVEMAHQLQGDDGDHSCSRIVPEGTTRRKCEGNSRLNGGVLLLEKRWREKKSSERSHKRAFAPGNSSRDRSFSSRMDTNLRQPSRRSLEMDGSGRLGGIRSVFRVPDKFIQLRGQDAGRQVCGLKEQEMSTLQQSDVLSRDGSSGCILSRLGSRGNSQLVGSPAQVDPKNPFVRKGDSRNSYSSSTRMEESVMVANVGRDVAGTSCSVGGQSFSPWPEQCYRTTVEPFLAHFSLPDNWRCLSPKDLRPALVVKTHRFRNREFCISRASKWASAIGFSAFAKSIDNFLVFSEEKGSSPDDLNGATALVKEFLMEMKFDALLGIHVQLAFSICKLWKFNPVAVVLSQVEESKDSALASLIEKGRSEATSKTYAREWNGYFTYATSNKRPLDDHNTICEYAAYLWSIGLISKAIAAINAVAKAAVLLGWNSSPADAPMVKEVKRALYRLRSNSTSEFKRDPLPALAVVNFILGVIEEDLCDDPYFQQCCLLLLFGFRLMLRAKSLSLLRAKDISVREWGLEVALAPIKSMQSWQRKHIEKSNDWKLCPVFWFNKYKSSLKSEGSLLFINPKSGGPISSIVITELVRKVAQSSNLDGDFSSHSLRIGGATAAALGGLSVTQIQAIGGWESFAVLRYIRSLIGISKGASEKMGLVAPSSSHTSVSSV